MGDQAEEILDIQKSFWMSSFDRLQDDGRWIVAAVECGPEGGSAGCCNGLNPS